jgi:protein-tyrosine phosphatase
MAEAVFRNKVKEAGLEGQIAVDSAGTGDWHLGEPPHEGTRKLLQQKGIDDSGLRARQVREQDYREYDYILAMDSSNVKNLQLAAPAEHDADIRLLLEHVPHRQDKNVPDPYFTGNFQEVYDMIDEASDRLLAHIRSQEQI